MRLPGPINVESKVLYPAELRRETCQVSLLTTSLGFLRSRRFLFASALTAISASFSSANGRAAADDSSDGTNQIRTALSTFASDSPVEGDGFEPSVPP
jgi:hypothetical protein